MRNATKLLAFVLAFVMVLSMVPMASAQTVHTHGIEEYPAMELGETYVIEIAESGEVVYLCYTPAVTAEYTFASSGANMAEMIDPEGALYDSDMNLLAEHSDNTAIDFNFTIVHTLEAGKTYVFSAKLFSAYRAGVEFYVPLTADLPDEHNYVGVVTTEPTCTEDGVMTYTCDHCGDSYTEVIPAGHDYVDGICSRCGETYAVTGVCGEDLTWKLDYEGTMTISGTGDMYDYAMYGEAVAPWTELAADIKAVVAEEGVTSIGNFAFVDCANLTTVSLPDSLIEVGESAFRNCTALTTVDFGTGLEMVSGYAFMNCASLTAADLGDKVEIIGNSAFFACSNLAEVNLGESLLGINTLAFSECTSLTEITMPDTLTALGSDVFNGCSALTSVKLSDGLTNLPAYTFNECVSLVDVKLPQYLTTIGERCFYYCQSLESIDLPFGLIAMDNDAFGFCTKLRDIELPMALSYIGYFAFNGCTSLGNLEFPPNLSYYTGTSATTFSPEMNVTRGQVVTFLWAAAGKPEPKTAVNPFVDVAQSDWYYKAVLWAVENGITSGMDATHFGPSAECTREQVVTFLYAAAGKPATTATVSFSDVQPGAWFYAPVAWAVENGITSGMGNGTFGVGATCTRAQIVTFLYAAQ